MLALLVPGVGMGGGGPLAPGLGSPAGGTLTDPDSGQLSLPVGATLSE